VKLGGEQLNNFASFFQVVKMFMVVVVIFAICWLPYHVYFIYTYHNKEVTTKPYIQHVYLSFYWLAMANAMINPAIYYGMNARYVHTVRPKVLLPTVLIFHGLAQ
jgi:tachykinin receptor 3